MATIAWTEEAQRWLEDIFEYIAADDRHAADRTVKGVYERAQVLALGTGFVSRPIRIS